MNCGLGVMCQGSYPTHSTQHLVLSHWSQRIILQSIISYQQSCPQTTPQSSPSHQPLIKVKDSQSALACMPSSVCVRQAA